MPNFPTQPPKREFQLHTETIAWYCCGAANGLKLAMRKDSVMTSCSAGPHGADIPRGSIPKKHKEMIGHMWYAFLQPVIRQSKMQGIFEFKWQSQVVFAASAPAFRPLFTAFQPTILAIKGSCDTTNSSSTCHISKVLSIIHDQFSKKKSMQTYSIPHLQILFVPNLHLCKYNFVVANIPLTLWLLTVVSKPDQKRIKGLTVWRFTTQENICTRKKEHTTHKKSTKSGMFSNSLLCIGLQHHRDAALAQNVTCRLIVEAQASPWRGMRRKSQFRSSQTVSCGFWNSQKFR